MKVNSYQQLIVWQKAMMVAELTYELTKEFPKEEIYGFVSQMRRAAVSIPSNIAEEFGRRSEKDYKHFYKIAYGSALEIETQLLLARKLNYGQKAKYEAIETNLIEVCKMLNSMSKNSSNK